MNPQMLNKSISTKSTIQKPVFKNILLEKWDEREQRLIKTEIVITITKDNQIMYFSNGRLLRIESIQEDFKVQQIFTNIEQVKHFQWQGEFEQNNKKIGKWIAKWNGKVLQDVGGYYSNGLKYGLWKEPIQNYWNKAQVFEVGQYINGQKRGVWMYIYNKKKLNGGQYNEQGQKNGKWRDLSDGFHEKSQVIYDGEYINGQKVGKWDIYFQDHYENKPKLIGGGLYNETGQGYKNGRWIELSHEFRRTSQITFDGQYINDKKVGRWDIYWNQYGNNYKIGGGSYDQSGNEVKINGWIELREGFTEESKITYHGEYQNGKQIGRWDVLYRGKKIGGGLYDQSGDGCKTGNWIESSDLFKGSSQVTYRGQYKNGKKVGKWVKITETSFSQQIKQNEILYDY
ncbi:unnamed protein product [Paramecium pentaurelia]|uniref:MORN repeat protein n=1 Tax=Paramecium pentaurelia TaxID=43138 RepID=A0A8S1WTP2_9CILI|nr:unnamed protein product [Paramecium pentaurelia]